MYFCATGENIQQKSFKEENQFVMMLCPVVSITKEKAYEMNTSNHLAFYSVKESFQSSSGVASTPSLAKSTRVFVI